MWELEKRAVPFKIPYDYYSVDELFCLAENLYGRTEEICDYLDRKILDFIPFFREKQFKPAHGFSHMIKIMLNTLCQEALNIHQVLQHANPEKVIILEMSPDRLNQNFYVDPDEPGRSLPLDRVRMNTYSKLIKAILKKHNISEVIIRSRRYRKSNGVKSFKKLTNFLQNKYTILKNFRTQLRAIKNKSYRGWIDSKSQKEINSPTVLVFKNTYSVGILSQYMKQNRIGRVIEFEKNNFGQKENLQFNLKDSIDRLWNDLREDSEFKGLFTFEGINFLSIADEYFCYLLLKGLLEIADIYNKTRIILKDEKIDVFLLSTIGYPDIWTAVEVCKSNGIPVIIWQHGNYAIFDPHTQPVYHDIKNADYFFAFGNGVRNAYLEEAKKRNTEIISIGSSCLDRININKVVKREKVVLVPLRRLNTPLVDDSCQMYPNEIYWRGLIREIKLFSRFPEIRFVLKLYPSDTMKNNPLSDLLRAKRINNVVIKTRPSFIKFLDKADLLIIDSPHTTLLEAVKTDLPIIFFNNKFWKLRSGIRDLIEKRCFIADDLNNLEALLKAYLSNGLPILKDKEFLCSYGIQHDDGNSLQRALSNLYKITSKKDVSKNG